jgi:hypothetical protein
MIYAIPHGEITWISDYIKWPVTNHQSIIQLTLVECLTGSDPEEIPATSPKGMWQVSLLPGMGTGRGP